MSDPIAQPQTTLVSLTCGATVVLTRLLAATGWNKTPKEKLAAAKIQLKTEELILSAPDQPTEDPGSPGFNAAAAAFNKAMAKWDRSQAPALELTDLQFQTVQACLKYFLAREDTGANRFLAELQEAFRVVE